MKDNLSNNFFSRSVNAIGTISLLYAKHGKEIVPPLGNVKRTKFQTETLPPGLVAFVFLVQLASTANIQTPALHKTPTIMAAGATFLDAKASNLLEQIPTNTCNVSLVNGGNYVLATPTACKGVRVALMTISVSAKSCGESSQADFSDLTNTTLFKGDFGFYLGQGKPARCLVVREMRGRYV